MSSKFDAYELIGVITPGSILLFGLALLFPDLKAIFFEQSFTLGDLGLFLVLSFVAGHLIQAAGNLLEAVVWKFFGGMPTEWLITKPEKLIHPVQVEILGDAVRQRFRCELQSLDSRTLVPIIRQMYTAVQAAGASSRIDTFNKNYGLLRGITASFAVLAIVALVQMWPDWKPAALAAAAALAAGYRMVRFGKYYGRELAVAYLRLIETDRK